MSQHTTAGQRVELVKESQRMPSSASGSLSCIFCLAVSFLLGYVRTLPMNRQGAGACRDMCSIRI
jgi:hypothetical protein